MGKPRGLLPSREGSTVSSQSQRSFTYVRVLSLLFMGVPALNFRHKKERYMVVDAVPLLPAARSTGTRRNALQFLRYYHRMLLHLVKEWNEAFADALSFLPIPGDRSLTKGV
jgi:hypothetical protein